jgi:hypothetical protein
MDMLLRRESTGFWSAESVSPRGDAFMREHVEAWSGTLGPVVFKETMSTSIDRFAFILDTERVKWDLLS